MQYHEIYSCSFYIYIKKPMGKYTLINGK